MAVLTAQLDMFALLEKRFKDDCKFKDQHCPSSVPNGEGLNCIELAAVHGTVSNCYNSTGA